MWKSEYAMGGTSCGDIVGFGGATAVRDDDVGTGAGQQFGGGRTDAAGSTSDHGALASEGEQRGCHIRYHMR
jgi:hypothetical protein